MAIFPYLYLGLVVSALGHSGSASRRQLVTTSWGHDLREVPRDAPFLQPLTPVDSRFHAVIQNATGQDTIYCEPYPPVSNSHHPITPYDTLITGLEVLEQDSRR